MKIGFDLAQASVPLAGCGWYAHTLLDAIAGVAPEHDFVGYRHFGQWINEAENLPALPVRSNITDPLAGCSPTDSAAIWQEAIATKQAPGGPAVVHSTSFQAPRFTNAKLVVTVFDLSFWAVPEFTTDQIRHDCQAGVLNALEHADGLVFISEHAQREFDRLLPYYRRKAIMATTVTPLASRWPVRLEAQVQNGEYWLSIGSLEPRKNLHNLLVAFEEYARLHSAPKPLWLAGARGWKNEAILIQIERLEKRGLVRQLGYVGNEELQHLYQHAHALLFPSWYEGFGLPVLEAMAQGCPVICSDRASLPEVGGNAAHYVNPGFPETITRAMLQLEENLTYRGQLAQRGLVQAAKFSWEQTAKQTLAFYDRVISSSGKSA